MNFASEINGLSAVCGNVRGPDVHRIAVVGEEKCDPDHGKRFGLQVLAHFCLP